jgi:tetratricopeptide (TPR) repeat protein
VHPVNPEAYDAYLKGRYCWNRRPAFSRLAEAIKCFEQAIAKDPTYAAAYAGLSDSVCALSVFALVSADEGCNKAKVLAQKALAIDHSSAEAHTALALATMYSMTSWLLRRNLSGRLGSTHVMQWRIICSATISG